MKLFDAISEDVHEMICSHGLQFTINEEYMDALCSYCDVIDELCESEIFDEVETSVSDTAITVVLKTPSASFVSNDMFVFVLGNSQRVCLDAADDTMCITIEFPPTWISSSQF